MIDFLQQQLTNQKPFVCYKKPFSEHFTGHIQHNETLHIHQWQIEGFIFYPFDEGQKVVFPYTECTTYTWPLQPAKNPESKKDIRSVNDALDKENHIRLVQKTIDFIQKGHVNKIVISRKQIINTTPKSPIQVFIELTQNYPEAFVYVWFHPQVGLWIGATPEQLVTCDKNIIKTMALAGTQVYSDRITWHAKEIEEQQFVTQYIISKLQNDVNLLPLPETYTKKAGHLAHLCTEIIGTILPQNHWHNIIEILHPTPAVCGTPVEVSKRFILEQEKYKRTYYTGFLGEYAQTNGDLYVNLRCAEWISNQVVLYVGGGITKDSIAEQEWHETVNKAHVLSRFF